MLHWEWNNVIIYSQPSLPCIFLRNILKREQYEKSLNLISVLLFLFCSENWSQLSICLLQTRSSLSQENCSFCPALSSHICQCCYCFPANITFEFLFQPQFNVSSCCLKQFSCLERLMAQTPPALPTYLCWRRKFISEAISFWWKLCLKTNFQSCKINVSFSTSKTYQNIKL